ncbi:hypothetical protein ACKLNR_013955 [Fusarium oxysporum f. sp. zingiberi]
MEKRVSYNTDFDSSIDPQLSAPRSFAYMTTEFAMLRLQCVTSGLQKWKSIHELHNIITIQEDLLNELKSQVIERAKKDELAKAAIGRTRKGQEDDDEILLEAQFKAEMSEDEEVDYGLSDLNDA